VDQPRSVDELQRLSQRSRETLELRLGQRGLLHSRRESWSFEVDSGEPWRRGLGVSVYDCRREMAADQLGCCDFPSKTRTKLSVFSEFGADDLDGQSTAPR